MTVITRLVPTEQVLSPDSTTLYVAGADGKIRAFAVSTGQQIATWNVGIKLGGMDVSPDGRYILVTEREPVAQTSTEFGPQYTVTVHRLDTLTGEVRDYNHSTGPLSSEYTFFDVSLLADGRAVLTQSYRGSGSNKMKTLDLETGAYTDLDLWIDQDSVLSTDSSRTLVLVAEPNSSDAPLTVLKFTHGGAPAKVAEATSNALNRGVQALSEDGNLVANYFKGVGLHVYDGQLRLLRNLADDFPAFRNGDLRGLAFDTAGKRLYILDGDNKQIVGISTETWTKVRIDPIGPEYVSDIHYAGRFGNNLLLTDDGRALLVISPGGVHRVEIGQVLTGGAGADTLRGSDSNDSLHGGAGDDFLFGEKGFDQLVGGAGNDALHGGEGSDIADYSLETGTGSVIVNLGNAVVSTPSGAVLAAGQARDSFGSLDSISGVENIRTGAGNDIIYGDDAANVLEGGAGDDIIDGGLGADSLLGGPGDDLFRFSAVRLDATPSPTGLIDGGGGTDTIDLRNVVSARLIFQPGDFGSSSPKVLVGTQGFDVRQAYRVLFGSGDDTIALPTLSGQFFELHGGAGDDVFSGPGFLFGQEGNDQFTITTASPAGAFLGSFDGGAGFDLLKLEIAAEVFLEYGNASTSFFSFSYGPHLTLASIEHVQVAAVGRRSYVMGSGANERLGVNAQFDDGVVGAFLDGGGGDDIISGSKGGDWLIGGAGVDLVSYADSPEGVNADLSAELGYAGAGKVDILDDFERLIGSAFADMLFGRPETDELSGIGGDDRLFGRAGDDKLDGGAGNDRLDGGSGADRMIGGVGDDTYILDNAGDLVIEAAGEGADTVESLLTYTLGEHFEHLTLIGRNNINGAGNSLDNVLAGNLGNNVLSGGGGNDRLALGGGVDVTDGGAGIDVLVLDGSRASYRVFSLVGADYIFSRAGGAKFSGIEQAQFADGALTYDQLMAGKVAFDGQTYAASYRDLAIAFGTDGAAATAHFSRNGVAEGRNPLLFEALRYVGSHADLIGAFGTNGEAARDHYLRFGAAEGRSTSNFDPLAYTASYPDLIKAFGTDRQAASEHYIKWGFTEGRTATFDPLRYTASYPDLIAALRIDPDAAGSHFIRFGFNESRQTTFDPLLYGATNPDLAVSIGRNPAALTDHYIQFGHDEDRLTSGFDPVGYLLSFEDLGAAGVGRDGALDHWLRFGAAEGRRGDTLFRREQVSHDMEVGQTRSDVLGRLSDHDWFQVTLTAGQKVTIALGSDKFDPFLKLHDASGKLVAFDADSGPGDDALLTFTAGEAGLYYLVVANSGGSLGGDYTLGIVP